MELSQLRSFRVVAETLNFTRAAERLNLTQAAVSHQIILTRCDELKPSELDDRIDEVETALAKRPAALPAVLATSAHDGSGIPELRAAIARLLAERGR